MIRIVRLEMIGAQSIEPVEARLLVAEVVILPSSFGPKIVRVVETIERITITIREMRHGLREVKKTVAEYLRFLGLAPDLFGPGILHLLFKLFIGNLGLDNFLVYFASF